MQSLEPLLTRPKTKNKNNLENCLQQSCLFLGWKSSFSVSFAMDKTHFPGIYRMEQTERGKELFIFRQSLVKNTYKKLQINYLTFLLKSPTTKWVTIVEPLHWNSLISNTPCVQWNFGVKVYEIDLFFYVHVYAQIFSSISLDGRSLRLI